MNRLWKPNRWVTLLVGITLQPFVFLYVNRPRLFWRYLIAAFAVSCVDIFVHPYLPQGGGYDYFYLSYIFIIVCTVHACVIAKHYDVMTTRRWFSQWWGVLSVYAAIFTPVILFRAFLFEPFSIPASSMSPTLNPGDLAVVKKWGFGGYATKKVLFADTELVDNSIVKRGRIYVFYPPDSKVPFVKRLIGLPGDVIRIEGGEISVNGEIFSTELVSNSPVLRLYRESYQDNSYLIQTMPMRPFAVKQSITVPENHFFFLGDNRDNSADSRLWGAVPNTKFVGEVIYVFGGPNS